MVFNIQTNNIDKSLILSGRTTFCNVRANYCNCVIIEKVEFLKYRCLYIYYQLKENYHVECVIKILKFFLRS